MYVALPAVIGFALGWALARTRLGPTLGGLLSGLLTQASKRGAQDPVPATDAGSADPASFVDAATGLANRRYLDMFLQREVGRAQRFRKPVSVAVFNVDDAVKLPADVVEQALVQAGEALTDAVRDYDVVARYAQARMVVALPEAPFDEALEVTERLRASLGSLSVGRTPISISVGLATFPDHGVTVEELVNAAHHFLNRGKLENPHKVHSDQQLTKAA